MNDEYLESGLSKLGLNYLKAHLSDFVAAGVKQRWSTQKDCERIERLIILLGDTIYHLFKARELTGNLAIDETPSTEEMTFHEATHELTSEEHHF